MCDVHDMIIVQKCLLMFKWNWRKWLVIAVSQQRKLSHEDLTLNLIPLLSSNQFNFDKYFCHVHFVYILSFHRFSLGNRANHQYCCGGDGGVDNGGGDGGGGVGVCCLQSSSEWNINSLLKKWSSILLSGIHPMVIQLLYELPPRLWVLP